MTDKASIRQQTAETLRAKHREETAPGQFEGQDLGLPALALLRMRRVRLVLSGIQRKQHNRAKVLPRLRAQIERF